MKSTRKSNGTNAASLQVGASCPPASEHPTNAIITVDKREHYSLSPSSRMPHTDEEAFRNFLLSRLPQVKAPQSLTQKVKDLIKNSQP